jgi:hypothetical protein
MSAEKNPFDVKARLPFSPTIKPSFAGASGGLSAIVYAIATLLLAGFAIYQMKVQDQPLTSLRVLATLALSVWFAVRTVMLLTMGRKERGDD